MEGAPAKYLGRIVSKENFRVFIYAPDGSQKLVNSWAEYEKHMETGLWFASPLKDEPSSEDVLVKSNKYDKKERK
jgi:hypothetical protein